MKTRWIVYAVMAFIGAAASPSVAGHMEADLNAPGLLEWWFYVIPLATQAFVHPGESWRQALWLATYFFQYVLLFALAGTCLAALARPTRPRDPRKHEAAFEEAVSQYHAEPSLDRRS